MDEYIITIIDSDDETANIKSYAETIEELVDNIVCMEAIKAIVSVMRVKDKQTWNTIDSESLAILREYRQGITDNIGLRNYLIGKEVFNEES
jgi:hypothetical protein